MATFRSFFANIGGAIRFGGGEWALGCNFMEFRHFPNIPLFPKILCLESCGKKPGNSYISCL